MFDGDCVFGQVVVYEVMVLGIEKVYQYGIVVVVLYNLYYIGCIGYWVEQCVVVGFVFIYFVSVVGILMVVLFYGCDSCFGINLFCVVFFCKDNFLLLFDYVISVIVFGKICVVWYKGVFVLLGCLIDVNGVLMINLVVMQELLLGLLLIFVEYKGYVFVVMCEIFGGAFFGGKMMYQEML